jgi:pyruvate/2-oxoglutarate dehydrogenase complex dihydrolipoamide dehydrogenase (E3) component
MAEKYKLVVIGAGPGGYVAAIRPHNGHQNRDCRAWYFGGVSQLGCILEDAAS